MKCCVPTGWRRGNRIRNVLLMKHAKVDDRLKTGTIFEIACRAAARYNKAYGATAAWRMTASGHLIRTQEPFGDDHCVGQVR
jgi:hypothetical protein